MQLPVSQKLQLDDATVEHVTPKHRSKGVKKLLAAACKECNARRGGSINHPAMRKPRKSVQMTVPLTQDEVQALMLALVRLSLERPGWETYLESIAKKFDGEVYKDLREIHSSVEVDAPGV